MKETKQRRLLLVANVSKEHIRKFHIPFIKYMRSRSWCVDVACRLDEPIPECDRAFDLPCDRNPFRGRTFHSARLLRDIIAHGEYDVVVCNTLTGSIITRIARRKMGRTLPASPPIVYINHGLHYFAGAPLHRWLLGFPTERALVPFCDVLVTINDADYEMARRTLHPRRLEKLNGIGVDLERFSSHRLGESERRKKRAELGIPEDSTVIAYTAELNRNKNQQLLLHAMKQLVTDVPNARLLLIGPEHDGGRTRRLAERLELTHCVTFAGWRSDVPELLAASDLYAASSLSEGLPINVLEAMASSLPVVAARNRGHAQLICDGANGYLTEKNDASAMAHFLRELCVSPDRRASFAEAARRDAEKYSVSAVLTEEERIITSAADGVR